MMLYRFNATRAKTSVATGPEVATADFGAIDVADAWEHVLGLLPCDGEWSCQLWQLGNRTPRKLKPKTFVRVTEEVR